MGIFQDMNLKKIDGDEAYFMTIQGGNHDDDLISNESSSSLGENSSGNSISSICSSSDLVEDASSASSSSSSSSNGPLYELSDLMVQLPIRRGLSKHYEGKSQSFTSLASVKSLEDLPKKLMIPLNNRMKMKSCKSYGWGLDGQRNKSFSPKATISKKSCFMSSLGKRISSNIVISEMKDLS